MSPGARASRGRRGRPMSRATRTLARGRRRRQAQQPSSAADPRPAGPPPRPAGGSLVLQMSSVSEAAGRPSVDGGAAAGLATFTEHSAQDEEGRLDHFRPTPCLKGQRVRSHHVLLGWSSTVSAIASRRQELHLVDPSTGSAAEGVDRDRTRVRSGSVPPALQVDGHARAFRPARRRVRLRRERDGAGRSWSALPRKMVAKDGPMTARIPGP